MKLSKKKIELLRAGEWGRSLNSTDKGPDAFAHAVLVVNSCRPDGDEDDDHRVHITLHGESLDKAELTLSLPSAMNFADAINRMAWASLGEDVFREAMRFKTYAAALDDIRLLADVTAQLDHMKNLLPAECAAVHESFVLVNQAHTILERILGDDVALVYAQIDEEQPT